MKHRCYLRGLSWLGLLNTITGCLLNRVLVRHKDESGATVKWSWDKAMSHPPAPKETSQLERTDQMDQLIAQICVREKIASIQHEIWSHWMEYLFSVCSQREDGSVVIPADKVARWQRQVETFYVDLTEEERESDREQADKVLKSLGDSIYPRVIMDIPKESNNG